MSTTTMDRTMDRGGERAGARGAGVRSLAWRLVDTTRSVAPTVARLGLGCVMFAHGAQKVLGLWGGYGFSGTMGFFTSKLGIPAPLAALAIIAEFFGSIALLFGFLTRVAAAGIGVVMLVAMAMVHSHVGFFMNWNGNQKGEGFEYHLLALTLCLVLLVAGGGSASIDRWLTERRRRPATI
jgi:putative oxidoreductase